MSTIFKHELKKILFAPAVIGFVVLCIALNIIISLAHYTPFYNDRYSGTIYNIFEDFRASDIAEVYVGRHGMTGRAEENTRALYDRLQPVIDEKAAHGDSLSLYFGQGTYFGEGTYNMHNLLFGTLLFAIIAQAALIAMFTALLSTGYENTRNTEQLICSAKIGRRIMRIKLAASLITGLVFFAVILGISLAVFFIRYDYSAVWNDSVSSAFNTALGEWFKPLITWHRLTVAGLLWAVIGAAAGLTIVFSLLGFAIGTFFRNSYIACGVAFALCILQFLIVWLLPVGGTLRALSHLTPVMLWLDSPRWFTDGNAVTIWAHFETIGITALLITLTAASVIAMTLFKRRNLL
jgi:hypothetical protein